MTTTLTVDPDTTPEVDPNQPELVPDEETTEEGTTEETETAVDSSPCPVCGRIGRAEGHH